jgi:D-amino peptidase
MHPAARVLQGQKAWSMVEGAQDGFDVALFVGYHARAGHPRGTIAHTYSGAPVETRLAGRPTGEYGLNALVLGAWGIPVGLVAGDDALAEEVADWLPWAERVVVMVATAAAASVHPTSQGPSPAGAGARSCRVRRHAQILDVPPPADYWRGRRGRPCRDVPGVMSATAGSHRSDDPSWPTAGSSPPTGLASGVEQ